MDYDRLPRVVIIVILPYDPFGLNRMVYTVKNMCVEDVSVPYEDGARKIFLYTKGTEGNPSQSLRDMLKYMQNTREENITNEDINIIHEFVEKAKHRKEVGINYMKIWEEKYLVRKEALAEGYEEGMEEGIKEGIRVALLICKELNASEEYMIKNISEKFSLSAEEAERCVKEYLAE